MTITQPHSMASNKIDLTKIKKIPIREVAEILGITIKDNRNGVLQVVDHDDVQGISSLVIFEKNNYWIRFSGKTVRGMSKGSVIDLVMHWQDCEFKEALQYLAENFPAYR